MEKRRKCHHRKTCLNENYRTQKDNLNTYILYWALTQYSYIERIMYYSITIQKLVIKRILYTNLCFASNLPWSYVYCFRHLESAALIFTFPVGTTNTVKIIKNFMCFLSHFFLRFFFFFSKTCACSFYSLFLVLLSFTPHPTRIKSQAKYVIYLFIWHVWWYVWNYMKRWTREQEMKEYMASFACLHHHHHHHHNSNSRVEIYRTFF